MIRGRGRAGLAALVLTGILAVTGCSADAPDPARPSGPHPPLRVVSLGDSYATGTGPATPTADGGALCGRTVASSVRVAAERVGATLVDVACDGSTTADLVAPSTRRDTPLAAQLDALQGGADVVLVRIGGNDLGFPALVAGCVAQGPTGPVSSGRAACVDALGPAGSTDLVRARLVGEVGPRLAQTYARIRAAAPDARVAVIGYLTVLGAPGALPADGCFRATQSSVRNGRVLLADRDAVYLASLQEDLDVLIQREAEAAGARFVDQASPTATHGSCVGDDGEPYVSGMGGTESGVPLHPNGAGLAWEADVLAGVLREESAALGR